MKVCPVCKIEKPKTEFSRTKTGKLGGYCRPCNRIKCKEYGRKRLVDDPNFIERERLRSTHGRSNNPSIRIGQMLGSVKSNAKKRGVTFDLKRSDISKILDQQNWTCARTKISFDLLAGLGRRPFGPTIDRIDCTRGYEIDNIQIVCNVYNLAKNVFSDDDVLTFARALLDKRESIA